LRLIEIYFPSIALSLVYLSPFISHGKPTFGVKLGAEKAGLKTFIYGLTNEGYPMSEGLWHLLIFS
jgi:hypothetical protein